MKTLVVLIILVLAALYVNADRSLDRNRFKNHRANGGDRGAGSVDSVDEEIECDPAAQYGWGKPQVRCRCPEQGMTGCLKCNICSCMGSRGMWRCSRMGCPFEVDDLPWQPTNFLDYRGRERMRCMQPVGEVDAEGNRKGDM